MITRLVLRHEIVHSLLKPLLVTVTTVSLMLNLLAFQMAKAGSSVLLDGTRAVLVQFVFLVPVVLILLLCKTGHRCRPWEAGLPLESKLLWWSHLLAMILSSLFLVLVTCLTFFAFDALLAVFGKVTLFRPYDLARLVSRPVAASLTSAGLMALWAPRSGRPVEAPGWIRFRILVIAGAVFLLGLLMILPPVFIPVPVVLAGVLAWRTAAGLPAALEMSGEDTGSGGRTVETAAATDWADQGPSARVLRMTILRTLFKWPLNWLALGPITILFGLMMSGYDILGFDEPYLRFLNFFMCVYILFASSSHFMENLHRLDFLPIDRRVLLRWLLLPAMGTFLLGYGAGWFMDAASADRTEKIRFENSEERYGLKVPADVFAFSISSEPRQVTGPGGETHTTPAFQVFKGLPGVLWKPYATPEGASLDFVAWQISRAAAAVYGLDIDPAEIADRYLDADLFGRVTVRDPGLALAADFDTAKQTSSGPVLPLLVGGEFVLLLVILGGYLRVFKPGITIRRSRIVFWSLMAGLMACHMFGYFAFSLGWTREWLVYGFWLGRIRELGATGPAGYGAAWMGMALLVVISWRWAEKSFLDAEAPVS